MKIKQFEYKPLAHYSYALISNGEMAVVDPDRDPKQYYNYAKANNAKITAVFQTHPHADFVSSHLQIHKETGAIIYHSKKTEAKYSFSAFDEGDAISVGDIIYKAINTPGHSPDSITICAISDKETLLFTGDTLFVGDVGRPDLRETSKKGKRQELAEAMYHTIQHKFNHLPDDAVVFPTHGAGSLCGKSMSSANKSSLGTERKNNWAFKKQSREEFVDGLLDNLPFVPAYFSFNVDINRKGADNLEKAIKSVPFSDNVKIGNLIIDMRDGKTFKDGHLKGSINIQAVSDDSKFETWLGSVVEPNEKFILVIDGKEHQDILLNRIAKIGYEKQLEAVSTLYKTFEKLVKSDKLDVINFKNHPESYTIIDVRNRSEAQEKIFFESALSHPLHNLRKTVKEIPTDKPIVVHCAGGYRSAIGASIIAGEISKVCVYDLGTDVEDFSK